jgi:hypothetical protein
MLQPLDLQGGRNYLGKGQHPERLATLDATCSLWARIGEPKVLETGGRPICARQHTLSLRRKKTRFVTAAELHSHAFP